MRKIIIYIILILICSVKSPQLVGQNLNNFSSIDLSNSETNLDELTGLQWYNSINEFNKHQNSINLRNDYKIKLDSVFYWFNNQGQLEINGKHEYVFDEENLKEIRFVFNRENNEWVTGAYNVYHFNKKDLLTKQSYNIWDGDYNNIDEATSTVRRELEYNEEGQLVLLESQNSAAIQSNRLSNRWIYSYNSLSNLSQIENFRWNSSLGMLTENYKIYYRYNEDNQLSEIVEWEYNDQIWVQKDSLVFEYDSTGNLVSEKDYAILFNDTLDIYEQKQFRYDDAGTLKTRFEFRLFDLDSGEWWKKGVTKYTYDSENNLINEISFDSIDNNQQLDLTNEVRYSHFLDYYSEDVQLPRSHLLTENSEILIYSTINPITEILELSGGGQFGEQRKTKQTRFFYSDIETNIIEIDKGISLQVTPNPVSDIIRFQSEDQLHDLHVMIYDAQGQLVKQRQLHGYLEWDVSDLLAGVYFYSARTQLQNDVKRGVGRFVKM